MRWFLAGAVVAIFAVLAGQLPQASGGCGCCGSKTGDDACPCAGGNCPCGPDGTCPCCPGRVAALEANRYWSSAHGCNLYYDPATRVSYYWSESPRGFFPVQPSAAAPVSSPSSTYSTRYYTPDVPAQGNPQRPPR
jgi:hypothetical protein